MDAIYLSIILMLAFLLAVSISNGMSWGNRYHSAEAQRADLYEQLRDMQQERIEELETERDERMYL